MARSKQANPMRREASSEYTGKHDRLPANGSAVANGKAVAAAAAPREKDNGLKQVVIAVGGIYGSL